jgi:hypothetical protein
MNFSPTVLFTEEKTRDNPALVGEVRDREVKVSWDVWLPIVATDQPYIGRPPATYQMPVGYSHPGAFSLPLVELPVTSSTYFIYRTQLSIITHDIVTQLYCPATIKETWTEVQDAISVINRRLVSWRDCLPREFDIMFDTWADPDWNDPYTLPRFGLAMFYNSSRMILFRPCLCRTDGRIDNQSTSSKDFEKDAVEQCIRSARRMIQLIALNAKTETKFYAIPPWWHTLHYLCEALSVLMLEMAFKAQHLPNESGSPCCPPTPWPLAKPGRSSTT